MNGFGHMLRALVIESVALVLLFWLAFHQQMAKGPEPAENQPVPLVIRTAQGEPAALVRRTQKQVGAGAREVYETALRLKRGSTELPARAWQHESHSEASTAFRPQRTPMKHRLAFRR